MIGVIIVLVLLPALLIWAVYNGDVYPREAGILAAVSIALHVTFFFLNWTPGLIVAYVATLIYLLVRMYGGDIKIR